jgi:hypothetical protein
MHKHTMKTEPPNHIAEGRMEFPRAIGSAGGLALVGCARFMAA